MKNSENTSAQTQQRTHIIFQDYIRLMIHLLRLSPSYELAKRSRNGDLSRREIKQLPDDFEQVLKTYDDYGDITRIKFANWWEKRGKFLYELELDEPIVRQIARISKGDTYDAAIDQTLREYFRLHRPNEGNTPALIVAIPLGLNKWQMLDQVASLIDRSGVESNVKGHNSLRPLSAKRLRYEPLERSVRLLTYKAESPDLVLWRLGLLAEISPKNAVDLNFDAKRNTSKTVVPRNNMAILTSRALKKAQYLCENAARGKFPSSAPLELPVFDYDNMFRRVKTYWNEMRNSDNSI